MQSIQKFKHVLFMQIMVRKTVITHQSDAVVNSLLRVRHEGLRSVI